MNNFQEIIDNYNHVFKTNIDLKEANKIVKEELVKATKLKVSHVVTFLRKAENFCYDITDKINPKEPNIKQATEATISQWQGLGVDEEFAKEHNLEKMDYLTASIYLNKD